jgi:transposase InsO family protein
VLGEAAGQLSDDIKTRFPEVSWQQLSGCGTGSSTATGRSTWKSCTPQPGTSCPDSRPAWNASSPPSMRAPERARPYGIPPDNPLFELRLVEDFATRAAIRTRVAAWIDEYNTIRRHSSIGMISPAALEASQDLGRAA